MAPIYVGLAIFFILLIIAVFSTVSSKKSFKRQYAEMRIQERYLASGDIPMDPKRNM